MKLSANTPILLYHAASEPVSRAIAALKRDMEHTLLPSLTPLGEIILLYGTQHFPEQFQLRSSDTSLMLSAGDDLGFIYGIYEISRRFLGVHPFWFWNDQTFAPVGSVEIPDDFFYQSTPSRVKYRGWFINDETLISHWRYQCRREAPWEMAMEALLRCGGNMVIPGTDRIAHENRRLAASMGLIITHHHAEPLGAEMFGRAYPDLEASFDLHPELFRKLWREGIEAHAGCRVIWNIGFRGQGDRPFWLDDPDYDTPQKRGELMSRLIMEQYQLVQEMRPGDPCCTNLYGETMELYQQGFLKLPEDVIKIWADNGFGKMVSRRQENANPRIHALPDPKDSSSQGLYYHVSFYDLQAASHITMLPNSAEFVDSELCEAAKCGVNDYWLVNCSNIKPHTYLLDLIAQLWQRNGADVTEHRRRYAADYYGEENAQLVAQCIQGYANAAVKYGENEDDHAGDQFYNHVPRMLMSAFMRNREIASADLRWQSDAPTLALQNQQIAPLYQQAILNYDTYLHQCEAAYAQMTGNPRILFADMLLLQAQHYCFWAHGADYVCRSLTAAFAENYKIAFYLAGCARQCFLRSNQTMRQREHGKWIGFYKNECQVDVKQTAAVCDAWMGYLRNLGEGPHFYLWQREFFDSEEDRRIMLQLNVDNHPTNDELWYQMEQQLGG